MVAILHKIIKVDVELCDKKLYEWKGFLALSGKRPFLRVIEEFELLRFVLSRFDRTIELQVIEVIKLQVYVPESFVYKSPSTSMIIIGIVIVIIWTNIDIDTIFNNRSINW